jgi:hypothetical protein
MLDDDVPGADAVESAVIAGPGIRRVVGLGLVGGVGVVGPFVGRPVDLQPARRNSSRAWFSTRRGTNSCTGAPSRRRLVLHDGGGDDGAGSGVAVGIDEVLLDPLGHAPIPLIRHALEASQATPRYAGVNIRGDPPTSAGPDNTTAGAAASARRGAIANRPGACGVPDGMHLDL